MAGAQHGMCELTAWHGRGTAWAWHGHGVLCVNWPLATFKYMAPVYVITAFIVLKKLLHGYVNYNNFIFMIGIH